MGWVSLIGRLCPVCGKNTHVNEVSSFPQGGSQWRGYPPFALDGGLAECKCKLLQSQREFDLVILSGGYRVGATIIVGVGIRARAVRGLHPSRACPQGRRV